ncbi:hypothetical protein CWI80_08860 [Pseudidiomarina sediminum]|uniref:RHS repeat-associated core domain-containing protein n=3 Tax=Pseudidiomarina sediminum TaxID=431675 RepID=A0A432Z411_9GAMM|nr:hypothetical protein CWI80_08860 [Pseudidiomarina sediminum]
MVLFLGETSQRERVKTTINGTSTYEIDKVYEETVSGSWKVYLDDFAIISFSQESGYRISYLHKDRLGSALTFSDDQGQVVGRRHYDAFGKPRTMGGQQMEPGYRPRLANVMAFGGIENIALTRRGFTDHLHLDELELIHMNGRVYDYNLGRFMSVDPFVQAPDNSQSLNPYSYLMNNPLAGTDPSGYIGCTASRIESVCGRLELNHGGSQESLGSPTLAAAGSNGSSTTTSAPPTHSEAVDINTQEREAIGGPGEVGTSGESALIAAGQAAADDLGNSSQKASTVAEGCNGIKCRAETYYGYQAALDMTGKCDGCVWFGVAGDMASLLYKGYDMIPGDFIGNGGWSTDSFMNSTNAFLFPHNTDNYLSLMRGGSISGLEGLSGKSLDVALVGFEQRLVQGQLDKFKSSNPSGYNSMISGLNSRFRFARQYNIGIPELNKVSHALNKSFGSKSFDFGNESHRVSLGIALAKERY